MHNSFHVAKTVKNRGPLIFIESIDLSAIFYEQSADIRVRIDISGVEGKVVQ